MTEPVDTQAVFVFCSCGRKHRLRPGVGAPYYWCSGGIKALVNGDEVLVVLAIYPPDASLYCNPN